MDKVIDKKDPLAARPLVRPVKPKKPIQIFPSFVKNSRQDSESAQTDESNDYHEVTFYHINKVQSE
jgi:hypothetical protein